MSYLEKIEMPKNISEDRKGDWMHTSLGGRFYPADVRPEDIHISDIANGLALDCRYGGQGRVDRFYSVAEHCYNMSWYCEIVDHMNPLLSLAVLLHDGAEAYLNDLPLAVKRLVGLSYTDVERHIEEVILRKYGVWETSTDNSIYIKSLDCRIVSSEKQAIMAPDSQPWATDVFKPLEGVVIYCWEPEHAKRMFLKQYDHLCGLIGCEPEEWEI